MLCLKPWTCIYIYILLFFLLCFNVMMTRTWIVAQHCLNKTCLKRKQQKQGIYFLNLMWWLWKWKKSIPRHVSLHLVIVTWICPQLARTFPGLLSRLKEFLPEDLLLRPPDVDSLPTSPSDFRTHASPLDFRTQPETSECGMFWREKCCIASAASVVWQVSDLYGQWFRL